MPRFRRPTPSPLTALLAIALLAATGCAGANDAATAVPDPDTTVTAPETIEPAPPPALVTVVGERIPAAHWVDSSGLLTHTPVVVGPPDTVLPVVHAVGDWLDAHLDDLQRGGPGRLDEVAAGSLLAGAAGADLAAVTTALASPAAPVNTASYLLDAAYQGVTEWVTATVTVTSLAGDERAATLVFVPAGDGLELVLFGAAP